MFGNNPAGIRMLDAPRHRRPDDVKLPDVDWQGLSRAIHAFWSVANAHRSALLPMVEYV